MAWFEQDFLEFFKELAAHNHKEWFDQNRKRYHRVVKEPFEDFVGEMISRLSKVDKEFNVDAKDCIFRINRDIRFSKDKTPYKHHMSAAIAKGGRKDYSSPGMYFELGPEVVKVYGGVYQLDKEQIQQLREYLAKHARKFRSLLESPEFSGHFGTIHGEKNKIIPKELKEAAEKEPFIFNKNWYYFAKLPSELTVSDELADVLMEHFMAGNEMRKFLRTALKE